MIILPAIDIKDGLCVRLLQGDFSTSEKVAEDSLAAANNFKTQGALWIHMVDLDGALSGSRQNSNIFINVAGQTGLKVELGGGIRTMESIEYYLDNGISRIVLGSAAVADPDLVRNAVKKYGGRIAVGIDAKNGSVQTSGWLKESKWDYIELAKKMEALGVETIIYTDISKDGTLKGPNLDHIYKLKKELSVNLIASGGIHTIEDIDNLIEMDIYGAICGKALYRGTLDLKEAIAHCNKER